MKRTNNAAGGIRGLSSKQVIKCLTDKWKCNNRSQCSVDNKAHFLYYHCGLGRHLNPLSLSLLICKVWMTIITSPKDCSETLYDDVSEKVQCWSRKIWICFLAWTLASYLQQPAKNFYMDAPTPPLLLNRYRLWSHTGVNGFGPFPQT